MLARIFGFVARGFSQFGDNSVPVREVFCGCENRLHSDRPTWAAWREKQARCPASFRRRKDSLWKSDQPSNQDFFTRAHWMICRVKILVSFSVTGLALAAMLPCVAVAQEPPAEIRKEPADSSSPSEFREIPASISLTRQYPGAVLAHAVVESESVNCGERVRFLIELMNASDETVNFERLEVHCNCLKVRATAKTIDPRAAILLDVEFAAPIHSHDGRYGFQVNFVSNTNERVASFVVSGVLNGVLRILGPSVFEGAGKADLINEWSIQIITTAPVDPGRLTFELSPPLRDFVGKLSLIDGKTRLIIVAPEAALGNSGASGQLTITDPQTGARDSVNLAFLPKPRIRIAPLAIRFRKSADGSDNQEATVLVQSLEDPIVESGDAPSSNAIATNPGNILTIACTAEGLELKISSTKISGRLHRIKLIATRSVENPAKNSLARDFPMKWSVRTDQAEYVFNGVGFLED